jgi:hypothetical protein
MSRKKVAVGAVVLIVVGLASARAQGPGGYDSAASPPGASPNGLTSEPISATTRPAPALSRWITGTDPSCCGPLGDQTPLMTELYLDAGPSFPLGDGLLEKGIEHGWAIQGGGRALFFNGLGDAAWTIDLHGLNIYNPRDQVARVSLRGLRFTDVTNVLSPLQASSSVIVPLSSATIGSYNRTFVGLGAGREWYLFGSAGNTRTNDGALWRIGIDGGGRWGTAKVELRDFQVTDFEGRVLVPVKRHRTDVVGAVYAAIHSDVDIPCGCCIFHAGLRAEWDYTWSDILERKSDVMDLNLLVNVGVRY